MKIRLMVEVNGTYFSYRAIAEVPELQLQCYEQLKTNSKAGACAVDGGMMDNSDAVKIVMKTRKDAADVLAKEISLLIVSEMEKNDTHNGYNKDTD